MIDISVFDIGIQGENKFLNCVRDLWNDVGVNIEKYNLKYKKLGFANFRNVYIFPIMWSIVLQKIKLIVSQTKAIKKYSPQLVNTNPAVPCV